MNVASALDSWATMTLDVIVHMMPDSSADSGSDSVLTAQATRRGRLDGFLRTVERRALLMLELGTRDREEALDLLQDCMLRFAQRYACKPGADWPPLFFKTLNNALIDWQRRRAVRHRVFAMLPWLRSEGTDQPTDPLERIIDQSRPAPDRQLGVDQFSSALQQALSRLPLRQRQAFLLRQWQGLSVAETATSLGISEGSVKTHLFRAQGTLREALHEHQ